MSARTPEYPPDRQQRVPLTRDFARSFALGERDVSVASATVGHGCDRTKSLNRHGRDCQWRTVGGDARRQSPRCDSEHWCERRNRATASRAACDVLPIASSTNGFPDHPVHDALTSRVGLRGHVAIGTRTTAGLQGAPRFAHFIQSEVTGPQGRARAKAAMIVEENCCGFRKPELYGFPNTRQHLHCKEQRARGETRCCWRAPRGTT
jgi:hypothetical protein